MPNSSTSNVPLFTIIAYRGNPTTRPDVPPAGSPNVGADPALDAYPEGVRQEFMKNGFAFERAASIAEMNGHLNKFVTELSNGQKFRLQLVAHGEPGRLSLAEAWTGKYRDRNEFYALDTNPSLLENLANWRGRLERVILAACNIGNATANMRAIGGNVLLFTLKELWECDVWGAVGEVDKGMFNSTGLFQGAMRRWDSPSNPIPSKTLSPPELSLTRTPDVTITLQKLVALRQPTEADPMLIEREISEEEQKIVLRTYSSPGGRAGSGISAADFTITVVDGTSEMGIPGRASLISDCRCLAVRIGKPVAEFTKIGDLYYRFYEASDVVAIRSVLDCLTAIAKRTITEPEQT